MCYYLHTNSNHFIKFCCRHCRVSLHYLDCWSNDKSDIAVFSSIGRLPSISDHFLHHTVTPDIEFVPVPKPKKWMYILNRVIVNFSYFVTKMLNLSIVHAPNWYSQEPLQRYSAYCNIIGSLLILNVHQLT